jgi:hypothetical protein
MPTKVELRKIVNDAINSLDYVCVLLDLKVARKTIKSLLTFLCNKIDHSEFKEV